MNCKPGDMAISVNTRWPENLGVIVTVVRRHHDTPAWNFGGKPSWWCKSSALMTWRFEASDKVVRAHEGPVPDECLRPIRPPRPADEQPCEELLEDRGELVGA